ncbi:MAG: transposase [Treponema sp.]|jgi:transposase|nr:transposase [Treponema sp.]
MKQYSKGFREQALELSDEIGLKKASAQLGVVYGTLSDWRKKRAKAERTGEPEDEIERLKRENAELKKSNSILRDALCFFLEDRKR